MSIPKKYALILANLDYILIDISARKIKTYLEIGWDEAQARTFVSEKKNWENVASFNTPKVTFSASSRRNRFFDIFWKDEYYASDVLYPQVNDILSSLVKRFHVVIVSDRNEDQKSKTLDRLKELGLPVSEMEFLFKGNHQTITHFKTESLKKVHEKHQSGLVVLHNPSDIELFRRYYFTPIGYTTTHDRSEFCTADAVCDNWEQILAVLNTVQ